MAYKLSLIIPCYNVSKDNIILGSQYWHIGDNLINNEILDNEIRQIVEAKKAYLMFSYFLIPERLDPFFNKLKQYGHVEKIWSFQGTPLYYFTAD